MIFSSLAGFLGHASLTGVDLPLLGWTLSGSAAGALAGSWLMTERLQGRQVKITIRTVLLGIAAKMAWDLW